MSAVKVSKRRAYRSDVRAEGARRTRRLIVAAATDLFCANGYARTSMAAVAKVAGVARPTVIAAFGSKPALLQVVLDQAMVGDDEPVPVAERPWFGPVWEATSAEDALDAYAQVCTVIGSRAARLFEVVRRASDTAPEVAALWARLQRNRRAGADMVVGHLATLGPLPRPRRVAVDSLWVLNDAALYHALVLDCGWSDRRFTRWLGDQMRAAVLPR